jgi:hypothetical protein
VSQPEYRTGSGVLVRGRGQVNLQKRTHRTSVS